MLTILYQQQSHITTWESEVLSSSLSKNATCLLIHVGSMVSRVNRKGDKKYFRNLSGHITVWKSFIHFLLSAEKIDKRLDLAGA